MANYTKREERRSEMHRMIEDEALRPNRYLMPRCACGANVLVASDWKNGKAFNRKEHSTQDIGVMIENSPQYGGQNRFE